MSAPKTYGYSCFNCREDSPSSDDAENSSTHVEILALLDGWQIGLDGSGQAHYGCKNCGPLLFNANELYPTHWPFTANNELWKQLKSGEWETS